MNVLLTSVGRRSYLVEYFKQAVRPQGKVYAANSEALTSGMIVADGAYTVPRVDSEQYIPALLKICQQHNIKLVVSLFDIDLPYLAKAREKFENLGIQVVVSDPWVIEITNDKWKTWEFLNQYNIGSPRTFLNLKSVQLELSSGSLKYPLIIKPRWGMGSLSVFRAENDEELRFFYDYTSKEIRKSYLNILSHRDIGEAVIIQEFIPGNEFGLDVFNNLNGEFLQTVAKHKLAMRSGETDIAEVVNDSRLLQLGEKLSHLFKHRGNIDVDILENANGKLFVLEINARFGGGYPFSHLAGVNYPEDLVTMTKGDVPKIRLPKAGCIGLKNINMIEAKI